MKVTSSSSLLLLLLGCWKSLHLVVITTTTTTTTVSAFQQQSTISFLSSNSSSRRRHHASRPTKVFMASGGPSANVDESAERDMNSFNDWAINCGTQMIGGFQLTTEDGNDWNVMTQESIQQGTPLLYVPSDMIIDSIKVKAELGDVAKTALDYLYRRGAGSEAAQFYLFLKLLSEYEKGQESPYYPWLNSLPRLYYNAVSMTEFCLECLPPLVFSLGRTERVKFDNYKDAVQEVDFISPRTKSDVDALKWAFNAVSTRCQPIIDSPGQPIDSEKQIVPMADMFNHGTETEVILQNDDDGNCIAYATRDIEAGSPLRMSYGDPTNPSHLFATYGFLDETSPATFCKIMTIQPTPQLKDLGLDFSRMLFYKDTGEISEEVYDVMLYHNLANNRDVQQQFYEAHMNGDLETKNAIHQEYFYQTATSLKEHVDQFLAQLDELAKRAEGKDIAQHPRLPLIIAHNDFVRSTFMNVKSNLDQMVGEPVYN